MSSQRGACLYCYVIDLCIGIASGEGFEGFDISVELSGIFLGKIPGIGICFVIYDVPKAVFSINRIDYAVCNAMLFLLFICICKAEGNFAVNLIGC